MSGPSTAFAGNEVRVWSVPLDHGPASTRRLVQLLSPDELSRANRFRLARHRNHYAVGRGLLRSLLGQLLDRDPAELEFSYTRYGKPFLANEDRLSFNVSHSGGHALFAFGPARELGVDLEEASSTAAEERVAEHFFAPREVAALRSLPSDEQPRAFLRCWTRKEAYIKARGEGLSLPLEDFEVTLVPDATPGLVHTAWSSDEPDEWSLYDLSDLCPNHVAALAVRGRRCRISARCWPGQDLETLFDGKELEWHS